MQAQSLESLSPLEIGGEHGASQAGKHLTDNEILTGQKPLYSNVLLDSSLTNKGRSDFMAHRDNRGVVEGWWNGRSHNRAINEIFKRLHEFARCSPVESSFHTVHVGSKLNPTDVPSQEIYPPESLLLPPV